MVSAAMAAYSAGTIAPPLGQFLGVPLLSEVRVSGRTSDKFAMGWLGGIGGTSQFQGANSLLPVLPPASNADTNHRVSASTGRATGQHLMTRWERPGNFNPGLGTDTWRDGENVTWTLGNRGLTDTTTGLMAPLAYPAIGNPGGRQPLPAYDSLRQGLAGNTTAPAVLVGSSSGYQSGQTLAEMQQQASQAHRRARMGRGGGGGGRGVTRR